MDIDRTELAKWANAQHWARKQQQDREDKDREFVQDWIGRFWARRVNS